MMFGTPLVPRQNQGGPNQNSLMPFSSSSMKIAEMDQQKTKFSRLQNQLSESQQEYVNYALPPVRAFDSISNFYGTNDQSKNDDEFVPKSFKSSIKDKNRGKNLESRKSKGENAENQGAKGQRGANVLNELDFFEDSSNSRSKSQDFFKNNEKNEYFDELDFCEAGYQIMLVRNGSNLLKKYGEVEETKKKQNEEKHINLFAPIESNHMKNFLHSHNVEDMASSSKKKQENEASNDNEASILEFVKKLVEKTMTLPSHDKIQPQEQQQISLKQQIFDVLRKKLQFKLYASASDPELASFSSNDVTISENDLKGIDFFYEVPKLPKNLPKRQKQSNNSKKPEILNQIRMTDAIMDDIEIEDDDEVKFMGSNSWKTNAFDPSSISSSKKDSLQLNKLQAIDLGDYEDHKDKTKVDILEPDEDFKQITFNLASKDTIDYEKQMGAISITNPDPKDEKKTKYKNLNEEKVPESFIPKFVTMLQTPQNIVIDSNPIQNTIANLNQSSASFNALTQKLKNVVQSKFSVGKRYIEQAGKPSLGDEDEEKPKEVENSSSNKKEISELQTNRTEFSFNISNIILERLGFINSSKDQKGKKRGRENDDIANLKKLATEGDNPQKDLFTVPMAPPVAVSTPQHEHRMLNDAFFGIQRQKIEQIDPKKENEEKILEEKKKTSNDLFDGKLDLFQNIFCDIEEDSKPQNEEKQQKETEISKPKEQQNPPKQEKQKINVPKPKKPEKDQKNSLFATKYGISDPESNNGGDIIVNDDPFARFSSQTNSSKSKKGPQTQNLPTQQTKQEEAESFKPTFVRKNSRKTR